MMDATLIARYSPSGDIYASLAAKYGPAAANSIYAAAQTGDRTKVTDAIDLAANGAPLNDSTTSIFMDQMETNPLAAPLESASNLAVKCRSAVVRSAVFRPN
jgi:hypothetical protein